MFRRAFSVLLFSMSILIATSAKANWIGNIQIEYDSPAYLGHGTLVNVSFDYEVTEPEGMQVQAYPWCLSSPFPDFNWSGSLVLTGSGSYTVWFTLNSGALTITHVRLRSWNAVSSDPLLELDLPVYFIFGEHAIHDIQFSPKPKAILDHNSDVNVTFDYSTTWGTDVLIFVYPYSGESELGTFSSGSPHYPQGAGSGTYWFRVPGADALVDRLKFRMENAARDQVLLEFFVETSFYYGSSFPATSAPPLPNRELRLEQNIPNPFNPLTAIGFTLPHEMPAQLAIYDLRGRQVISLWEGRASEGRNTVFWNGKDSQDRSVASGVYIYRLEAGGMEASRRMLLLR
jgi:hypothetical protein